MSLKGLFERASYAWRIRYYIENLEKEFEELPEEYEEVKQRFLENLRGFVTIKIIYVVIMMTFYASVVTSATAAIGFKVNIFEKIYSIMGFTVVGFLYFLTMYLTRLARADLENSRTRVISYLTAKRLYGKFISM